MEKHLRKHNHDDVDFDSLKLRRYPLTYVKLQEQESMQSCIQFALGLIIPEQSPSCVQEA